MTMRAIQKRNTQATADLYGQPDPESLTTVNAALPCYVWSKSTSRTQDGDKTATIEEIRAMVPKGTDLQPGDILESVADRLGTVIFAGPLIVQGPQPRLTHLEARLKRFNQ